GDASASLRRWSRCLCAAKASALRRSASSPFMVQKALEDEHHGADRDRRIGDVEGGPMPARGMEIEKIHHLAEAKSIDQVAERASQDERKPRAEEPPAGRAHEQRADDRDRDEREADEQRRLPARRIREKTESRALVIDEHHVEE